MGEVVALDVARRRRVDRLRRAVEDAPMHPALRWLAGGGLVAHRRAEDGRATVCGEPGPLTLADAGTRLCLLCYPQEQAGRPS